MEIEKTNRMNALFEFYSTLLTEKQMNYIELYYGDDLSLGEIAEEYGVSRQAVYDNIKRTEKLLETYEKKLHLYSNYIVREEIIEEIKKEMISSDFNNQKINELLENIQEIEEE
ncbi:putative DNA-binding protein [Vagococcus fluvialis]|nr:putative DNA-binding protein [Vagococcus fluvialis]MBO0418867.1 putative DNA-binding protein [Vagococcus fluvialis]OTP29284.1 transcriptional regulator [Enterococcus sp. 6C8_DIV0013]